jgi:hypothetical protein
MCVKAINVCVLRLSMLRLFLPFSILFLTVLTVWYFSYYLMLSIAASYLYFINRGNNGVNIVLMFQ